MGCAAQWDESIMNERITQLRQGLYTMKRELIKIGHSDEYIESAEFFYLMGASTAFGILMENNMIKDKKSSVYLSMYSEVAGFNYEKMKRASL